MWAIPGRSLSRCPYTAPGEPFRPDVSYKIRVGVDEDQAERTDEGEREELRITWFVTPGDTRGDNERGPSSRDGNQRTAFVEGTTDFEDLLENLWSMPVKPHTTEARLFVVLRDNRGGGSWAEHRFNVAEAK